MLIYRIERNGLGPYQVTWPDKDLMYRLTLNQPGPDDDFPLSTHPFRHVAEGCEILDWIGRELFELDGRDLVRFAHPSLGALSQWWDHEEGLLGRLGRAGFKLACYDIDPRWTLMGLSGLQLVYRADRINRLVLKEPLRHE